MSRHHARFECLVALLLALLLATPGLCASRPPPHAARLDGALLVQDGDVLEKAYERLHPGLYRYASPAQVKSRFAHLRQELAGGATLAQAYAAFSRFAATVRCGHTYANFYNQPAGIRSALFESGNARVPFYFRWIDGRMVIVRAAPSVRGLLPGTEVLSLDGVDTGKVLAALMPYARADGANDAKRVAQLQVLGDDKYESFDVFLPLAFPGIGGTFDLTVRRPGEHLARHVRVAGLT